MGLLCMPVGVLTGVYVSATAIGNGYQTFLLVAPVAAFLSGVFAWWLIMERVYRPGIPRAAFAGALAALLGHYLCWYLLFLVNFLQHVLYHVGDSVGGPPVGPIAALFAAGVYSLFSLLILGWVTVAAGAILGAVFGAVQRPAESNAHSL